MKLPMRFAVHTVTMVTGKQKKALKSGMQSCINFTFFSSKLV